MELTDHGLNLKNVIVEISKSKEDWKFGLSAYAVFEDLVLTLTGAIEEDHGKILLGICGEISEFSIKDFNTIYRTHS